MIELADFRVLTGLRVPPEYVYAAHMVTLGFKLLPEQLLKTWNQLVQIESDDNDPRDQFSPFVETAEDHGFLFRENHVHSMDHIQWQESLAASYNGPGIQWVIPYEILASYRNTCLCCTNLTCIYRFIFNGTEAELVAATKDLTESLQVQRESHEHGNRDGESHGS